MSSIIDIIPVGYSNDGRRKITDEQKQEVRRLYEVENASIHHISRTTGVSRRSVQFILFPERAQAVKDRAKEVKRWQVGNLKENHTSAIQKHRAKKKLLLKTGQVKITPEILTKHRAKLNERNLKKKLHIQRKPLSNP